MINFGFFKYFMKFFGVHTLYDIGSHEGVGRQVERRYLRFESDESASWLVRGF